MKTTVLPNKAINTLRGVKRERKRNGKLVQRQSLRDFLFLALKLNGRLSASTQPNELTGLFGHNMPGTSWLYLDLLYLFSFLKGQNLRLTLNADTVTSHRNFLFRMKVSRRQLRVETALDVLERALACEYACGISLEYKPKHFHTMFVCGVSSEGIRVLDTYEKDEMPYIRTDKDDFLFHIGMEKLETLWDKNSIVWTMNDIGPFEHNVLAHARAHRLSACPTPA
ncbi:MAG: hypothetical protein WDZ88_00320 [Candidatus Paceibacterota bacterium]